MSGDIHGGHRARMKTRYLEQGLDSLADHEALELLLYYAIPRADVNPLAHRLIDHFGSFHAVLEAEVSELTQVEGVGESTALLIKLIRELDRRYLIRKTESGGRPILDKTDAAGAFFLPYFHGLREEAVYAAFLDDDFRLLKCRKMFEGSVNFAPLSVRKLVEAAIREHATNLILAHNHPMGQAIPSVEDRETTQRLAAALAGVQLQLADHIIVAGEDYLSMAECGYFERVTL